MPIPKIAVVFGTRPEAIKLAPVVESLKKNADVETVLLSTAQHRGLLDQALAVFGIVPDLDLDLMRPGQTLDEITVRILDGAGRAFDSIRPALVLVQGDTTTVFASALAAFYRKIRVAHVEAGLRAGDRYSPFPEEINRKLASALSSLHFAPTAFAAENLRRDGVPGDQVFVTGNPVIDAVHAILARTQAPPFPFLDPGKKLVLMTAHRRESFGKPMQDILRAVKRVARSRSDVQFVYPVHPNPNVRAAVESEFGPVPSEDAPARRSESNVTLLAPLSYVPFVHLMKSARILLTDSGGIQEEGTALGKPILVMRDRTERPEAVDAGAARLVGTDAGRIAESVTALLDGGEAYEGMARVRDVFGDGKAGERIARIAGERASLDGSRALRG